MVPLIPLGIAIYLIHFDSRQMRQELAKIQEEKEEFLSCFDIFVLQSGYLKKKIGVQDVYVPSLRIEVSNLTDREFGNLKFNANFKNEGKTLCRASASLMRLRPLETKEIYLRSIDSAVFGSLVRGLSLIETTGEIEYAVIISHQGKQATVAEGKLEFTLFIP